MKDVFKGIGIVMFFILFTCAGIFLGLKSGKYLKHAETQEIVQDDSPDTIAWEDIIMSPTEAMLLQERVKEQYYLDSVLMAMPQETVENVAKVMLVNRHTVTKKEFVKEYINNKRIYDGIRAAEASQINETINVNNGKLEDSAKITNRPRDSMNGENDSVTKSSAQTNTNKV
ncbi:hypothetical protein [Sharpea azabuensis]|uniref:hypothetical protein n=1 Tax=Sharpea azabuensis TaxID=322505 RepID=UPI0015696CFD|nr:hypothetical protein [Sharpea azabuensis]